jgi:hypothetical protein
MKKRGKRHSPEQIVKKLGEADVMLDSGNDLVAALQSLKASPGHLKTSVRLDDIVQSAYP